MNTMDFIDHVSPSWSSHTSLELARIRDLNTDAMAGDVPVAEAHSLAALVQAVGYLRQGEKGRVLLRGQSDLYGGRMAPSVLRPLREGSFVKLSSANQALSGLIRDAAPWQCPHSDHRVLHCPERVIRAQGGDPWRLVAGTRRFVVEPLLQHYGIRTRWIDVVDNLWVALWFACHDLIRRGRSLHVVRRVADSVDERTFLVAVVFEGEGKQLEPGLWWNNSASVVDLRSAAPSFFVRPHAQHGLLYRPCDDDQRRLKFVAISVRLQSALDWLGQSVLLSPFGLFPPMGEDYGYQMLFERFGMPAPSRLGHIDLVGPGY